MSIRNVINKQISAQTNGLLTRGQYGATVVALQEGRNNSSWPADLGVVGAALTLDNGSLSGGAGYSDAVCVATTGGSGTGLLVNITTAGGVVTAVTICDPGVGYMVGQTINITGGDGAATFTVDAASDNTYAASRIINLSGGTASDLDTALAFQTQPAIQVRLPEGATPAAGNISGHRQLFTIRFPTENQGFPWPFTAQDYFETNLSATVNGGFIDAGTSPLGVCAAEIIRPADANSSGEIVFRRINIPASTAAMPTDALIDCILEARLRKLNVKLITGNNDLTDATDDVAA